MNAKYTSLLPKKNSEDWSSEIDYLLERGFLLKKKTEIILERSDLLFIGDYLENKYCSSLFKRIGIMSEEFIDGLLRLRILLLFVRRSIHTVEVSLHVRTHFVVKWEILSQLLDDTHRWWLRIEWSFFSPIRERINYFTRWWVVSTSSSSISIEKSSN